MLWITGVKGLLGSTLLARCKETCLGTGRDVDITDLSQIESFLDQNPKISGLVNCAAYTNVDQAESSFQEAFQVNVKGAEHLALALKKRDLPMIHISTDYVFSKEKGPCLREEDPVHPCNVYGKTKLEGEKRVLDLSGCVIRTSWLFGQKGKNLISNLLLLFQKEKEIQIVQDQWSKFTYAPDLADAILQMIGQKGLYHFANQGVSTKYEFALALHEEALRLGFPLSIKQILPALSSSFSSPCPRPIYSALDTTKIEKKIKIRHWKEALKDFLCEEHTAFL